MPKTEILVHITAPSRAVDDASYRSLAAAYLAFEPRIETPTPLSDGCLPAVDVAVADQGELPATQNTGESPWSSQRAFLLESPDLSFRSAADNLSSPGLGKAPRNDGADESQSSWRAPPSVIPDSNPENNLAIPQYCSPTRILEHYLQAHEVSQSEPSQAPRGVAVAPVRPVAEETGEAPCLASAFNSSFTELGNAPHSISNTASNIPGAGVIPQSPLASCRKRGSSPVPVPASSGTQAVASSSEAPGWNTSTPLSQELVVQPSRADSAPPPSKRQKGPLAKENAKALARSSSDIGPRQEQEKVHRLDGLQRAHQSLDGLQIYSPAPAVSCETLDPSDFVTETLAKLARDLDINKRYQPQKEHRSIRPFERGYWLVDCTTWAEQLKNTAWGFLTNYVGNGVAGWGIRCCRDKEFRWIRLYCWGAVVGHMHLVLYLASQRKILYTGSTWMGGDGEVVIVMGARTAKSA